jgi:hypothetical protein
MPTYLAAIHTQQRMWVGTQTFNQANQLALVFKARKPAVAQPKSQRLLVQCVLEAPQVLHLALALQRVQAVQSKGQALHHRNRLVTTVDLNVTGTAPTTQVALPLLMVGAMKTEEAVLHNPLARLNQLLTA